MLKTDAKQRMRVAGIPAVIGAVLLIAIRRFAAGNLILDKRCLKNAIRPVKLGLRTVCTKAGQMVRPPGDALTQRLCVQASRPSAFAGSDVQIGFGSSRTVAP